MFWQPTEADVGENVSIAAWQQRVTQDFTDNAGNGILIATDNLYMCIGSENTGGSDDMTWKLLYRFRTVPVIEYVGIVQSQQSIAGFTNSS